MTKHLRLNIEARTTDYPMERVFALTIHDDSVGEWTLGLLLLREGLIERLVVTSPQSALKIELRLLASTAEHSRARSGWTDDSLELHVSGAELDYWLRFFLKYVRDGYGEVDHLDVQTTSIDTAAVRPAAVVLKVERFTSPVSREDALRRLRQ